MVTDPSICVRCLVSGTYYITYSKETKDYEARCVHCGCRRIFKDA